jgi:hypothetical protein
MYKYDPYCLRARAQGPPREPVSGAAQGPVPVPGRALRQLPGNQQDSRDGGMKLVRKNTKTGYSSTKKNSLPP